MSFFKKLFGIGSGGCAVAEEPVIHEGYRIVAAPMKEGGQYRLAGVIAKEINGEEKIHQLIRADVFSSRDEAVDFTIRKAKQVIAEQGDKLFG